MRRRTLGVAVGVFALLAGLSPAVQAAPSPLQVPASFLDQKIDWKRCVDPKEFEREGMPSPDEMSAGLQALLRIECGEMVVPLDWNSPDPARTIKIFATRLKPKSGTAKGVVFTNPGGPGAVGNVMPLMFTSQQKLADTMEIVGIDVRGTGGSANVTCTGESMFMYVTKPLDPRNRSAKNVKKLLAQTKKLAKACQKRSGALGRTVNTEQTVKDLDLLRHHLGYEKINWIGYSAGTWLGAHYAAYFPQRTGRFVLDSNVDFTRTWQDAFALQPLGFERRFRKDFTAWVAKNNKYYKLGKSAEQVRLGYEAMRAELAKDPLPMLEGGQLYATDLDNMIAGSLYDSAIFSSAARVLSVLRRYLNVKPGARRSASALRSSSELALLVERLRKRSAPHRSFGGPYMDAESATFYATTSNDTAHRGTVKDLVRKSAALGKKYPLIGASMIMDPAQFWKRPALTLRKPTGKGAPGALMVQSVNDPATPYEGAKNAHQRYAGSRLLTVTGEGDHGIYAGGNNCVDRIVENYLVDGLLPAKDLKCKGLPMPSADQDGEYGWTQMSHTTVNPLSALAELQQKYGKYFKLS